LGGDRDGLLYVPEGIEGDVPLVVALHGAGGSASSGIDGLRSVADRRGFIVLAPDSRGSTWDAIRGSFGPDSTFIDRALTHVLGRYPIDDKKIAIEGFSDGASYALSLGITNGDLFTTIVALSPGSAAAAASRGRPRVWISHGTGDPVLPIEGTSRKLAPALNRSGFHLRYTEFEGGHEAPEWLTTAAIEWWLGRDRDA
jgi:phospholipase/carboxylesterase